MEEWDLTTTEEQPKTDKVFKVGKFYKHNNGTYIAIRALCNTTQWLTCLFVETTDDQLGLVPVAEGRESDWELWSEITAEEWDFQFVSKEK